MRRTSDTSLARYIGWIEGYPRLTREQEQAYWQSWSRHRDEASKDSLVGSNLRYVVAIAMRYRSYAVPMLELIAEGNLGVLHALKLYDPERGFRFVTYASHWIRAFMLNYIIHSWSLVGAGSGALHSRMFFRLRRERARVYGQVGEGESADALLAERVGLSRDRVGEFTHRLSHRDESLDRTVYHDGTTSLVETLVSPNQTQEQAYAERQTTSRASALVRAALDSLDQREKRVIESYWMRDEDERQSLAQIGRELGVSRERARQLEARARRKLRQRILEISEDQQRLADPTSSAA